MSEHRQMTESCPVLCSTKTIHQSFSSFGMGRPICFPALGPKNIRKHFSSNFLSTEIRLDVNVDSLKNIKLVFFFFLLRRRHISEPPFLEAIGMDSASLQDIVTGLLEIQIFSKKKERSICMSFRP